MLNAGLSHYGTVEETTYEDFVKLMQVNYFGTLKTVRAILPHFKARKSGTVLLNASQIHNVGYPLCSAYSASKAAISTLVEALRQEVEAYGIRVCGLEVRSSLYLIEKY